MDNPYRQALILGALLHDIGKFWQRCEKTGGIENAQLLDAEVKTNLSSDFCPHRTYNQNTYLTHQHAAWTYQFLVNYESHLYKTNTPADCSILQLAANHHRPLPSNTLQTIIQVADCISAGQDRTGDIKDIETELKREFNYRKQRLRPIFESIFKADYKPTKTWRYSLSPLNLDDTIFCQDYTSEDQELWPEYQQLWDQFVAEFAKLPTNAFPTYLESLLSLLQKYTWCIPSSTNDSPDISLYDHLRSTAALAVCLYDYLAVNQKQLIDPQNQTGQSKIKTLTESREPFALLVAADLSGIQKFIYHISSVKAATSLKGRSFYLQLLIDAAARYFLYRLDLPLTNLVYASGGNFYLLVPNTPTVQQTLSDLTNACNADLLQQFQGELFLSIGQIELSGFDFINNLTTKWNEAIQAAAKQKRHKFAHNIVSDPAFFRPIQKSDAQQCDNCGLDCHAEELIPIKPDETDKYCPLCRRFIRTGNSLKSADLLLEFISDDPSLRTNPHFIFPFPNLPIGYCLTNQTNLEQAVGALYHATFKKINYLNQTAFLPTLSGERYQDCARSFRFYGGNYLPLNAEGEPVTFDYLAGTRTVKAQEPAFKRLGVLRMDVDNLGLIFSQGFRRPSIQSPEKSNPLESFTEPYSLSRVTTLSSMLDLFFSGYLNHLHRNSEFRNYLYILYAGGDDLFIVGRWDKVVDCATQIYNAFKRFTGYHPDLSISAGIVLTPPKYPIHRSADLAGEAENKAKKPRSVNNTLKEKDAVNFLDKTLSWNDFQLAQTMKNDLFEWLTRESDLKPKMNHGLLNRLNQIYATYLKEATILQRQAQTRHISKLEIAQRIYYNKWRWHLVYSLKRFCDQNKKFQDEIAQIQNALIANNTYKNLVSEQPIITYLDVVVKWTEYLIRTLQKED